MVLASHRGRYQVYLDGVTLTAARARELRDFSIVPGDNVELCIAEGASDLSRIESISKRFNAIKRTSDDSKSKAKTIAANVDQVAIITSTTAPNIQPEFIKRVILESLLQKATPFLIITKSDLAKLDESMLPDDAKNIERFDKSTQYLEVLEKLKSKNTVFIGLSGAGKSTLINQIFPDALRKTSSVSENGDGKHTSTSSESFIFEGGLIIDTPGIRSFGLGHHNKQ
ncbi:MAG: ribosome small subunit-dependent GTPase A [Candidatus Ancillula sp.]|nr:ribosome small subunit-dependent GTPase A [Candidatus Ancillula sp.]